MVGRMYTPKDRRIAELHTKLSAVVRKQEDLLRRAEYYEYQYQIRKEAISELIGLCTASSMTNGILNKVKGPAKKELEAFLRRVRALAFTARNPPDC